MSEGLGGEGARWTCLPPAEDSTCGKPGDYNPPLHPQMLNAQTQLGPYRVIAQIGAGGMGEVYRATDTRLGREVAIKVLPPSFGSDPDRLRRFEQEARATGILNHPNILSIFDVGQHDGAPFVVSELLEGETLREKLGGAKLPVKRAIDYAEQLANGLAAAHEKGIIHRDLKPENIFVTRDGRVKILDFGLARVITPVASGDATAADAPTAPIGTDPGVVLGTVGYMSPEQVRGKPADVRSDVFAYGTILYEMLTGRRAFRRESAVETMNAILKEEPPEVSSVDEDVPPALERIVAHCLEKQPEARFQSARDIGFSLATLSELSSSRTGVAIARRRPRRRLWAIAAGAAVLAALLVLAGFTVARRNRPPQQPRYTRLTFKPGEVIWARFSPVDQSIVYGINDQSGTQIVSVMAGVPDARVLGYEGHGAFGISSKGELALQMNVRFIKPFTFSGTLATVPLAGGTPRELADDVQWADWAPDGKDLLVVRSGEGTVDHIEYPIGTIIYRSTGWIDHPRFSPDGSRIAFLEHPKFGSDSGYVAVMDVQGKEKRKLTPSYSTVRGLAWSKKNEGEIWFTGAERGGLRAVHAVTVDGKLRLVLRVPSPLVVEDMDAQGRVLLTQVSERTGTAILAPGADREREYSWFDWTLARDLSPDGSMLLFDETGESGSDTGVTYVRRTDGSAAIRMAEGTAASLSPDGKSVVLVSGSPPRPMLVSTRADKPRPLPADFFWCELHPDGRRVVGAVLEGEGARYYVANLDGTGRRAISQNRTSARRPAVSPSGEWLAGYDANGLALFPTAGGPPRPLRSTKPGEIVGGWSNDGRYLFAVTRDGETMPFEVSRIDIQLDRREPGPIISCTALPANGHPTVMHIAGDGKSYAYSYHVAESTLMLVEDLD